MATSALKDFEGDEVEPPVDDTPVWTSPRTPLSLVGELPTDIQGSDSFQSAVRQLLDEFRDVFSKTLSEEPARVTPLRLEVDHTRWHSSAARLPPRLQGAVKGKEILLQTSQMLELGLIRPSQEAYHSQVHLVRKPNDKWRFTIDFRLLNDATTKMSWPLPNIGEMLERIGSTRPTIFSKFDLTSGYHQFPLEEASRRYTAFVTPFGTYEYTRVPMGITPAGSYFQQTMAVEVLAELLHQGREIYLDDLLQYDNSEEVHLIRLRETFTRARVKNLKFHPEKMVIGASAIGFVGHLIDTTGIRFSDEKLDGIRDFALPKTKRDLKSFLGLANYFRDHVSHHSDLAARLQGMIGNYEQKQRSAHLLWTPDLLACYSNLQEAIIQCQKLFYLDDSLPIHLATDASDYALGAYLYQVRPDGTEIPIRFVSKSFTGEQLRWNVPEKECYAIVFTLKKLEHLLRDNFFVLHTDHENLTRCYSSGSPKVYRWKLLIQGFNMDIVHIKGVDNIVADSFSRLATIHPSAVEEALSMLWQEEPSWDTADRWLPPQLLASMMEEEPEGNWVAALESIPIAQVPPEAKAHISEVHNSYVGHHGLDRTLKKLYRKGLQWPQMSAHVRAVIGSCPCCQKMSQIKAKFNTEPFTVGSYKPMEYISFDTIGPLQPDEDGNTYILVVIDNFSRFVVLYPSPNVDSDSAIRALLFHCGVFGRFKKWRSDKGTQFCNDVMIALARLLGTEHIVTVAGSKEENSLVERANKETMRHLRNTVFDLNLVHKWSRVCPLVTNIINTEVSLSTSVSPREMMFAHLADKSPTPSLFLASEELDDSEEGQPVSQWVNDMRELQLELIIKAQKHAQALDLRHLQQRSSSQPIVEFPVGSFVLRAYPTDDSGVSRPPHKLLGRWQGPFVIIEVNYPHYTLRSLTTGRQVISHVSRLKLFYFDAVTTDPNIIAHKDTEEAEVRSVVSHEGSLVDPNSMRFLVSWADGDDDSWLTHADLKDIPVYWDYCSSHGLNNLIPRAHRASARLRAHP
jgi:hypothetical protein